VYEKKPRTTVDLKQNIRDEVVEISPTMLQRVMQNFQKLLLECANKDATLQTLYSGSEYGIKML
jgi:3-deoxy-D-arabino-heptulosonate 7-phosphate (DAHP) synthase